MKKLHAKLNSELFVPKEGQRNFACSNKKSLRCPSLGLNPTLSKDTIVALEELGDILKGIHKRIVSEGYEIKNGYIVKDETKDVYERN
jgi:hypothetical protein